MSKLGIGVQLYTVRDLAAKDFPGTVKKVAELGYRYVELAGYGNLKTAQDVKKALDDAGLKAPSGHWAIDVLRKESELQRVMDDAGKELTAADLYAIFEREYGIGNAAASVVQPQMTEVAGGAIRLSAEVVLGGWMGHV